MLQLQKVLRKLGWPEYEILVYSCLVESGSMKAADIMVKTQIPPGRIYSVLNQLQKKGTIKKGRGRPAIFDAQNPRFVLEKEMNEIEEMCASALAEAEDAWESRFETLDEKREKSWTVMGLGGIVIEMRRMFETTRQKLILVSKDINWMTNKDFTKFDELIIGKGGVVKVVSTESSEDVLQKLTNLGAMTYIGPQVNGYFCISDNRTCFWVTSNPDVGTVIVDENMAEILSKQFEDNFGDLKPLEVKKLVT